MIQKVFNCEVCEPIIEDDIIHVIFADKKDSAIGFDWSWWNAEYKEPTTKNDLGVDTVSRKAVHDMLENLPITVEDKWFNWLQKACMRLAELPSVTPQQPRTGHWIVREDNTSFVKQIPRRWVECSYCGWSFSYDRIKDDYCSKCGSDNREVEE